MSNDVDNPSTEDLEDIDGCDEDIQVYTHSGAKKTMRAFLDTGATCNLIRRELAYETGHRVDQYNGEEAVNADGTLFMPEGQVVMSLHFTRSSNAARIWTEVFLLVPEDVPYDILLSRPFIRRAKLFRRNHTAYVLQFTKETDGKL